MEGGVTDDAPRADVFAPEFELGFDEADELAVRGVEDAEDGREHEREGDEGEVEVDGVDGLRRAFYRPV